MNRLSSILSYKQSGIKTQRPTEVIAAFRWCYEVDASQPIVSYASHLSLAVAPASSLCLHPVQQPWTCRSDDERAGKSSQ